VRIEIPEQIPGEDPVPVPVEASGLNWQVRGVI